MRKLLLILALVGCYHPDPAAEAVPPTFVHVISQRMIDYDVYMQNSAGMTLRIGFVPAHSSIAIAIPPRQMEDGLAVVQFIAVPVGLGPTLYSDTFTLHYGDRVEFYLLAVDQGGNN